MGGEGSEAKNWGLRWHIKAATESKYETGSNKNISLAP